MDKMPKGVRFVGSSIEINFQANGKRTQTTLPLPQSPRGVKAAVKIRSELISKAKLGLLTEEDITLAKGKPVAQVATGFLFEDYVGNYLRHTQANSDSATGYRRMLHQKWLPIFLGVPVTAITTAMLRDAIDSYEFATAKTRNNNLIPLRGLFDLAYQDGVIDHNPMDPIKNDKVQEDDPDPFTMDETERILQWLKANCDNIYYDYYELSFFTGCRPSELLALHWTDYDPGLSTLSINKSRVRGVEKRVTKTHTTRTIHLNKRAIAALERLQVHATGTKHIFVCPETGLPFFNEKPPRVRFQTAMESLGIRHRRAYNTRHTYATLLLTSGVTPFFAADQLGHSLQMMLRRYAKWIDAEKSRSEIAKLQL